MARPSKKTPEEKMRVVLAVLPGEASAAEAGCKAGVSEQTMSNLKRAFLDSGRASLDGNRARRSNREMELEAENEELKAALGEAQVELRVWKKGSDYLPPFGTSK